MNSPQDSAWQTPSCGTMYRGTPTMDVRRNRPINYGGASEMGRELSRIRTSRLMALLAGALLAGCGGGDEPNPSAGAKRVANSPLDSIKAAQQMSNQLADPANTSLANGGAFVPPSLPGGQGAVVDTQQPVAAPGTELVAAQPGVGIKGRSLDQHEGLIVTPAKTLFKAKERIAFEIAIPHALNLYIATNGDAPKTHAEFMQKVVIDNNIQLPLLPPGHQYEYDPESKELMVRRPQPGAGTPPAGQSPAKAP